MTKENDQSAEILSANNGTTAVSDPSIYTKPKLSDTLVSKWTALPSNDQIALGILVLFIVVVGGGFGGYKVHQAAEAQQEAYQTAITDYFWLRGQAGNIDPSQSEEGRPPIDQQLRQLLSQSGASDTQVVIVGEGAQISFSQPNQAVASNILSAIVNSGYQIKQLNMQQNPEDKIIRVQATVL